MNGSLLKNFTLKVARWSYEGLLNFGFSCNVYRFFSPDFVTRTFTELIGQEKHCLC